MAPWGNPTDRVRCHVAHVEAPGGATVIRTDKWSVWTVEHLLAACTGAGLTDLRIVVDGSELPALDGSAEVWFTRLSRAGCAYGPTYTRRSSSRGFRVVCGAGVAHWEPSDDAIAEVRDGERSHRIRLWSPDTAPCFSRDVAWARTFVRREDIARLRAAGRGRGATWSNTVFLGGGYRAKVRGEGEPLRHKLLDLVGDLTLIGQPWSGHVIVEGGSHELHHAVVRRALAGFDSSAL